MKHIPDDINAELLLSHDCGVRWRVKHTSTHHRNVTGDVAAVDHNEGERQGTLHLGRASLYNALPEYMFHTVDRFSGLDESRDENAFTDEVARQEQECKHALQFFAPLDALLLRLRLDVRARIERHTTHDNPVLQNIIGDRLTAEQRSNRFIAKLLAFLPACHRIRGNRTLITLMLRKVLQDEGIGIEVSQQTLLHHDDEPRYNDRLDETSSDFFAGNDYYSDTTVYRIHHWSWDLCDEHFLATVEELEQMRQFVQDWFLGLDQQLEFEVWTADAPAARLSDTECHNYLNYNTVI